MFALARVVVCVALLASLCLLVPLNVSGHGSLTWPPSNRQGGQINRSEPGDCSTFDCFWFSQLTGITGYPTVNDPADRTFNVFDSSNSPSDWSRSSPWRSPGSAPVRGSGCGVAGGSDIVLFNGGISPPGIPQGMDGAQLPPQEPVVWEMGSVQEVAFSIRANHGGGYQYRMCQLQNENGDASDVTEECFQRTPLDFAGTTQWLQYGSIYPNQPRFELPPMRIVTEGVYPPGSQWARNPIPACDFCSQASCGQGIQPNYTDASGTMPWGNTSVPYYGGADWINMTHCGAVCAGESLLTSFAHNESRTDGMLCPPGGVQFPEPLPGVSGFVRNTSFPERSVTAFNVVDLVVVPTDIAPGRYLLSWRWDCEQSPQIWQNCADIEVVKPSASKAASEAIPVRARTRSQRRQAQEVALD